MAHVKKEFDRLIAAQINISRSTFTKERINQHIARYEYANTTAGIKDKREYELLSRYDVVEVEGNKRLIKKGSNPYRFYCNTDELYELLKDAHISCNHGGEKKIMRLLSQKYANITMNQIKIFKSVCEVCRAKKFKKDDTTDKWISTISEQFGNRGQINTIDFHRQPHNGYSYILYYYDHETKFNSLRPLHSTEPAEIATQLVDVFTIFGAPRILHSNNGRRFVRMVINELCTIWPELLIVEGRIINTETANEANAVVEDTVRKWIVKHPNTGWPDSLKFIQLSLNNKFNESILTTPFKALFNQDLIIGLNEDIPLSIQNQTRLETEEDLEAILASYANQEDLSEGESIDNAGRIKIEETYQEDMTEADFSILDTLTQSQMISLSADSMVTQLQCKICRNYIIANVQTCVKCNSQVHDTCAQPILSETSEEHNILCKWCIGDILPSDNSTMKNKNKRKGDKNRELDSKKAKNIMGYEELCPMIFIDHVKSEMPLPEMLSTFDNDDQLFSNDAISLLAQDMSSSQFELNDIFHSETL